MRADDTIVFSCSVLSEMRLRGEGYHFMILNARVVEHWLNSMESMY